MARIVIIGAGISGLAAAARLATLGHRVTVCEAAPGPGGMLGQYRRDGFAFDTGPTLLTLPAVYRDLALKTGREPLEQLLELAPVDPESRHLFADGTELTLPNASRGGVAKALDQALGADTGRLWGEVMNRGRTVWEATRRPLLEEPLPADPGPLGTDPYPAAPRRGLARLFGGSRQLTVDEVAQRELGGHPALTALLTESVLRFGFDPRTTPASATVLPYVEQTFGVWSVRVVCTPWWPRWSSAASSAGWSSGSAPGSIRTTSPRPTWCCAPNRRTPSCRAGSACCWRWRGRARPVPRSGPWCTRRPGGTSWPRCSTSRRRRASRPSRCCDLTTRHLRPTTSTRRWC